MTEINWPVIHAASSPSRNETTFAMPCGCPSSPRGVWECKFSFGLLVLTDCRLCERDGLFLGYQENWRSAGRNLHRVSERLLATFRSRACFQSLHRRKMYFGDAVKGEIPCGEPSTLVATILVLP